MTYPSADHVLILADSGGSNGARVRAWKFELQHKLCDKFGIGVRCDGPVPQEPPLINGETYMNDMVEKVTNLVTGVAAELGTRLAAPGE